MQARKALTRALKCVVVRASMQCRKLVCAHMEAIGGGQRARAHILVEGLLPVKALLEVEFAVPLAQQVLFFETKQLQDGQHSRKCSCNPRRNRSRSHAPMPTRIGTSTATRAVHAERTWAAERTCSEKACRG